MKDYLTGTRGRERKRRGKEKTHANTPGPERANPERARKKKSGGRRTRNKTSGGPDLPREGRTHEIGDQMGD